MLCIIYILKIVSILRVLKIDLFGIEMKLVLPQWQHNRNETTRPHWENLTVLGDSKIWRLLYTGSLKIISGVSFHFSLSSMHAKEFFFSSNGYLDYSSKFCVIFHILKFNFIAHQNPSNFYRNLSIFNWNSWGNFSIFHGNWSIFHRNFSIFHGNC